jgi:hypothetical protein
MATVNKNFRIKHGLVVEGTTGTINGQNILTETGSDTYILNLIGGETLVKSTTNQFDVSVGGELSLNRTVVDAYYDAAGSAATAQGNAEDYADGLASNYDAAGAASAAQGNAEDYADTVAGTAETNAKDYTDLLLGDNTINGTGGNTVTDRIATAIADLVDSAPGALDTLNELAAALGDNVDGMTGIATAIGNKLPLAGGTMSGNIAMGNNNITGVGTPSANDHAATKGYVDTATSTAQSNAEDYADGLASNYDAAGAASAAQTAAEGYADGLVDDLLDATTPFTEINVNDQAKQIAATASINTGSASTVYQWAKADYRSAKLLVKIDNGTHNEVSEILVTLDSSDNVAITEYAIVGTNGSRGAISAVVAGSNVTVTVNPTNNSTVKVTGTLLK